jgi:hypothetical protein
MNPFHKTASTHPYGEPRPAGGPATGLMALPPGAAIAWQPSYDRAARAIRIGMTHPRLPSGAVTVNDHPRDGCNPPGVEHAADPIHPHWGAP